MCFLTTTLMCAAAALLAGPVLAQSPAPVSALAQPPSGGTPEQMPLPRPTGFSITADRAATVAAAVWPKRRNTPPGGCDLGRRHVGRPRLLLPDGQPQLASIAISQGKARTAVRFRRESRAFYTAYETGHMYVHTLDPGLVASPGGFPLIEAGKIIGAVGCSGGTGDQDATVCKAGADTIK